MLEGLPGVEVYQNDITVYGSCVDERDPRLNGVLEAVAKSGLKLNREK